MGRFSFFFFITLRVNAAGMQWRDTPCCIQRLNHTETERTRRQNQTQIISQSHVLMIKQADSVEPAPKGHLCVSILQKHECEANAKVLLVAL